MSRKSQVWIIERDHKPLIWNGQPVCFTVGSKAWVRRTLNEFPTDDGHYYDAVLYQRLPASPSPIHKESRDDKDA